jgi:leader peptidase (prepilin peptidase)/N-methyltransferase
MTEALVVGACAVGGLLVGSFLCVIVDRVPAKRPVLASPFPEVAAALHTRTGWILVGGTSALFAGVAARLGPGWEVPAYLVVVATLIALSVIDLRLLILPNRILLPMIGVSIALFGVATIVDGDLDQFVRALACAAGAFIVFFALHVAAPSGMGFGDVKLAFLLGLTLGWSSVAECFVGFMLGFVLGAVIGVALIAAGVRSRKQPVPFGPFLAAGTIIAIFVGDVIVDLFRR